MLRWVLIFFAVVTPGFAAEGDPRAEAISTTVPLGVVADDEWTMVRTVVRNPTDAAVEATIVTFFDAHPNVQFAKRVWLPPRSQQRVHYPVRWPGGREGGVTAAITTLLVDQRVRPERQLSRQSGLVARETSDRRRPGMMQRTLLVTPVDEQSARDLLLQARQLASLTANFESVGAAKQLPPLMSGLGSFSHVVVAEESPAMDTAQMEALRSWVMRGGRLWIMMDRTPETFGAALLGDAWTIEVIDRTRLTPRKDGTMVRVLAPQMEVLQRVEGWPVAMRKAVGRGEFYVTTAAPPVWRQESLGPLAQQIFAPRAEEIDIPLLTTAAAEEIGRPVTSRGVVLGSLATLTGAMVVIGVVMGRRRRLDAGTGLAVGCAVVTTAVLVMVGWKTQTAMPLTVSTMQVATVSETGTHAVKRGGLAVYAPTGAGEALSGGEGEWMWLAAAGGGELRRLVWEDGLKWRWEGVTFSEGAMTLAEYEVVQPLERRMQARGVWGAAGLQVDIERGLLPELEQAWVIGPGGVVRLAMQDGERRITEEGETMIMGRSAGGILSKVIAGARGQAVRDGAMVVGWTREAWGDLKLGTGNLPEKRGSAVVMPLTMEVPKDGERFVVPWFMIRYEPMQMMSTGRERKLGPARLYDAGRGEWMRSRMADTVYLSFELPREARQIMASKVVLDLAIDAPGQRVEVGDGGKENWPAIEVLTGPTAARRQTLSFEKDRMLTISEQGRIVVGVRVREGAGGEVSWQMIDARLTVHGMKQVLK